MPNRILCAKLRGFKADIPTLLKHFEQEASLHESTEYFDNNAKYRGWAVTSRDGSLNDGVKYVSKEGSNLNGVNIRDSIVPTPVCTGVLAQTLIDLRKAGIMFCRTRLMMLSENFEMKFHRDSNLECWRLHIPIKTNPNSYFEWKFDDKVTRIHLPADGGAYLVRVDEMHRAMNYTLEPAERLHLLMGVTSDVSQDQFESFYEYKHIVEEISLG